MNMIQALEQAMKKRFPKIINGIKLIGFIVVLKKIIKLMLSFYKVFLRKRIDFKKKYGQNTWAFITGSSDGIGKAFAFSLAKQGFNIVLCARTLSKLELVEKQILGKYPAVKVQILQMDFKLALQENYIHQKLEKIKQLQISILVNNVGVDVLQHYRNLPQSQIVDLVKINCFPVTILNHFYIPIFRQRLQKINKKSAIINVASMAGEIPMPLHHAYSASKAYVDFLSRALSYEQKDIDIISLRPSQVSTAMTSNKPTDVLTITAEQCAEGFMNQLGHQRVTNGFWTHQLQGWLYSVLPECVFNYFWLNYIGPDFINERKAAQTLSKRQTALKNTQGQVLRQDQVLREKNTKQI